MLMGFLSSMACTNCFGQSEVAFSKRSFTKVPHTTISLIKEYLSLSNSHLELNFLNSVAKSWKFWPSCCLYGKNLGRRINMLFLGLQYSKNLWSTGANFISSPSSKVEIPHILFLFDQWSLYFIFITLGIFFSFSQTKIKVFLPKFLPTRYIAVK